MIVTIRYRKNMAHARQSRPDSGVGLQVKLLPKIKLLPSRSVAEWLKWLEFWPNVKSFGLTFGQYQSGT